MLKMLSKRQVTALVLYSPAHIARLEAAGEFPQRVKLGNNRVGGVGRQVLVWLKAKFYLRCAWAGLHSR